MDINKVQICFKIIEWVVFICLCGVSFLFMTEVLDKFQSKATTYEVHDEDITDSPAITICQQMDAIASSNHQLRIGKDFEIRFASGKEMYLQDIMTLLHFGKNKIGGTRIVFLEKKVTVFKDVCLTISPKFVAEGEWALIEVKFNESLPVNDIPSIDFHITSETNAYGIIADQWEDGDSLSLNIDKFTVATWLQLSTEKFLHLPSKRNCRKESFYECLGTKIFEQDFSQCPRKCHIGASFPEKWLKSLNLPRCKTLEEKICVRDIMLSVWNERNKDMCPKACSFVQYKSIGQSTTKTRNESNRVVSLGYSFSSHSQMTVHQEHYIFDTIGMIASVGGTLGMFIGFSFNNVIIIILDTIKNFIFLHSERIHELQ